MTSKELGLCASCHHAKKVPSRRKYTYYQCNLYKQVAQLKKYPYLPVEECTYYNHPTAIA